MSQIKLDYLSVTQVRGNDAESFLQAQLTADLTSLGNGEACFSAFCQPTGNVLAVLLVISNNDGMMLIASADLMDGLITELSRFVMRADVQFEPLNQSVFGCPETTDDPDSNCVVAGTTKLRYCISEFHENSSEPEDVRYWRTRELQSGLVWLNEESSGEFIPQMLGVDKLDGLSFGKGCFPGQEVIARVRYLGKLKRRPVVVKVAAQLGLMAGSNLEVLGVTGLPALQFWLKVLRGERNPPCFLSQEYLKDQRSTPSGIRIRDLL